MFKPQSQSNTHEQGRKRVSGTKGLKKNETLELSNHTPVNQIRQRNFIRKVSWAVLIKMKIWFDNTLSI